jgi:hypothetical protein
MAWIVGAAAVPSTTAGIFINIEPVVGASLGVLAFHDPFKLPLAIGGALIVTGSLVVVLNEAPSLSLTAEAALANRADQLDEGLVLTEAMPGDAMPEEASAAFSHPPPSAR